MRNTKVEILRIISSLIIVMGHSASKGGAIIHTQGILNLIYHFIGIGANLGSNILIFISVYYWIETKYNFKNFIRVWLSCILYYCSVVLILFIIGYKFKVTDFVRYLLPISGRPYWFVTAYIVTFLLRPFIDRCLTNVKGKLLDCFFALLTVLFILIPFIFSNTVLTNELLYFLYLYLAIYWSREKILFSHSIPWKLIAIVCVLTIGVGNYIIQYYAVMQGNNWDLAVITKLSDSRCPILIICAFSIFASVIKAEESNNPAINRLCRCSLGVYLIHCHPFIKNDLIWEWTHFSDYYNSISLLFLTLVITFVSYLMALLLDIIFQYFMRKIFQIRKISEFTCIINTVLESGVNNQFRVGNK